MPMGYSQNEPLRAIPPWQLEIRIKGHLLLSEQAELKAYVLQRGGIFKTEDRSDHTLWSIEMPTDGATAVIAQQHLAATLARIVRGDRIDSMLTGIKRGWRA